MTNKEITELRRLGDYLIELLRSNPEYLQDSIKNLENLSDILSQPIITTANFNTKNNVGDEASLLGIISNSLDKTQLNNSEFSEETIRIATRLRNFDWKKSRPWKEIQRIFGSSISLAELKILSSNLAKDAQITQDRDAKRRKSVMIKWMDENWELLSPHLHNYSFDGKNVIRKST
ncbi:hypothetical protein GPJ56_001924 [Histomonas meleagridis]|nr:hypothetical protein GPJ56_001924 [Histomonas meleagridis]